MGDEIHRKVERGNSQHRSIRESPNDGGPTLGGLLGIQALEFTVEPARFFRRPPESRDGPTGLGSSPSDRFAVLGRDELGYPSSSDENSSLPLLSES